MTDSHPPSRALPRRRRANAPQPRARQQLVWVTDEEKASLARRAAEQRVSVSRLLVESALGGGGSPEGRRAVMAQLFELRRLLATMANNVNQLARSANITGEVPTALSGSLTDARDLMLRIDVMLEKLAGGGA